MGVHVVMPWRDDGDPYRQQARDWVLNRWAQLHPDWPVHIGEVAGDWCKADAVGAAAANTNPDDILIVADADVWCDDIAVAVAAVESGDYRWAVPHTHVYRLSQATTDRVLDGLVAHNSCVDGCLERQAYLGVVGGGITVITGELYDDVPLDPRFVGWGQEDEAWGHALHALGGRRWRASGPLWHLWHQPQQRMNRSVGNVTGQRLRDRYRSYRQNPDMLRQLIDGGRQHQVS